jgi:hypothetical protein
MSLAHWPWPDGQRLWPEKKEKSGEKEDTLTNARVLVWTAWQGSARAAGQRLPDVVFTTASPGTLHHRRAHAHHNHQSSRSKHQERARRGIESEVTGDGGNRGESNPRSPRRGNSHQIQLEEGVEGVGATDLPRHRRRKSPELAKMLGQR